MALYIFKIKNPFNLKKRRLVLASDSIVVAKNYICVCVCGIAVHLLSDTGILYSLMHYLSLLPL